ncbi:probable zinc metalloprotease EGY1, chloroplastic isoform X2 [Selaginella moellendorffii]|uniref:probable zinc metalloprotease EGY1, chloroplastic isoform X2 n=1 Tax=Selaginella moellendorffii TaxID=88036 RepID=UPI000D1CD64A|nr:probable zinc metalloprotease EGY1, chloroplastic isoform X2 [Selaginella moellendorffii]|eukprot:XP_024543308.1 probable zinc metalloprotease EGY1, chloroplastic isoform X2 [Selaginella moellendorffii]
MAMAMERLGTLNTTAPTGCVALFSDASIRSRSFSITKSSRCRGIRLECGRLRIGRRNFHVVKCESGPDDGEKDGKNGKSSASTATEDGEDETKPSSSSHQPPQNGFQQAGPKTVQLDAFRFMELVGPEKVDPEDVKLLKDKVFGYTTFWVTGQEPFGVLGEGILFLGNLRGQREEVFAKLQKGVRELIGNKYDLFMVEEPNSEEPDPRGGPRVSFLLLRKEASDTGRTGLWQYVVAAVLFFITAGACLQLGFATQLQVSKLPPEIVQYFTNPESTEPPDLDLLVPYVESALPLAYGVFGVQLFHEIGHRLAAAPLGVKLGIPYFIPNITLGSFGAITQFKSICPDRKAKFDVSMAGPLAGGFLSVAMVGVGLLLSAKGAPEGTLVQVPSVVFQGSFLLGLVARAALGYDASAGNSWLVWTNDDSIQLASSGMYRRRKSTPGRIREQGVEYRWLDHLRATRTGSVGRSTVFAVGFVHYHRPEIVREGLPQRRYWCWHLEANRLCCGASVGRFDALAVVGWLGHPAWHWHWNPRLTRSIYVKASRRNDGFFFFPFRGKKQFFTHSLTENLCDEIVVQENDVLATLDLPILNSFLEIKTISIPIVTLYVFPLLFRKTSSF